MTILPFPTPTADDCREAQVIFARSPLEAAIDFGNLPPLTLAEIEGGELLAQFHNPHLREPALQRAEEWSRS